MLEIDVEDLPEGVDADDLCRVLARGLGPIYVIGTGPREYGRAVVDTEGPLARAHALIRELVEQRDQLLERVLHLELDLKAAQAGQGLVDDDDDDDDDVSAEDAALREALLQLRPRTLRCARLCCSCCRPCWRLGVSRCPPSCCR